MCQPLTPPATATATATQYSIVLFPGWPNHIIHPSVRFNDFSSVRYATICRLLVTIETFANAKLPRWPEHISDTPQYSTAAGLHFTAVINTNQVCACSEIRALTQAHSERALDSPSPSRRSSVQHTVLCFALPFSYIHTCGHASR